MARNETISSKPATYWNWVLIAIIVLALGAAIFVARPGGAPGSAPPVAYAAAPAQPASPLRAREGSFDFGSISMAAGNVSRRFWFRNESVAPVRLTRIYTSCMCTTATLVVADRIVNRYGMPGHGILPAVNETLAPGAAAYIDAVFDPAAHGPAGLGRTNRVVTIENDAGAPLELHFSADVRP